MAIRNGEAIFASRQHSSFGFRSGEVISIKFLFVSSMKLKTHLILQRARDSLFMGPIYASNQQLLDKNVPQLMST